MASAKKDSLDTSRGPVYRLFKSKSNKRERLFSTLIVEDSNSPVGNVLKHCDPIEVSVKTEDFSKKGGANFDEEDVKHFEDSDTNGDNKAAVIPEIDNPNLAISGTNRRTRRKLEAESPSLFYANPLTTAAIQEEEEKIKNTADKSKKKTSVNGSRSCWTNYRPMKVSKATKRKPKTWNFMKNLQIIQPKVIVTCQGYLFEQQA